MKVRRIVKTAGYGFLGFCAVSLLADKVDLNPMASQVAGFAGAFIGTLVGPRMRKRSRPSQEPADSGRSSKSAGSGS